jgi:zinc protease
MTDLDRTIPPTPGRLRPFRLPDVERSRLRNGLELYTATLSRLPLVTTVLTLEAGESRVPGDRPGLAFMAGQALQGGTALRSGEELAEALEGLGAALRVGTGWDSTSLALTCHADRLREALSLVAEIVLEPSFPEVEVTRVRNQRLAAIRQRRMTPGGFANDMLSYFLYPQGHVYGRPLAGTASSVAPLDRGALQEWTSTQFLAPGAGLVTVGDVDPGEVARLAEELLGGIPAGDRQAVKPPPGESRFSGLRIVVVDRPGAVQSEIRLGHVGISMTHPDYFRLKIFNTVLGGAFTSRLMLSLREEHGFTYGVRSGFRHRRGPGPFTISAAVGTDVTADAVREARVELEGLLQDGPTEEEAQAARDFLAGVFPLQFETSYRIASRLSELVVFGLPDDHFSTYRDRIRSVTSQDALAAGRRALGDGSLTAVVVGDASAVAGPLEALGLGPVDVVSEDEVPPFYSQD